MTAQRSWKLTGALVAAASLVAVTTGCGQRSALQAGGPKDAGAGVVDAPVPPGVSTAPPDGSAGPRMLEGVDVTPGFAALALGTSVTFVTTGRYSDGTRLDLTAMTSWAVTPAGTVSLAGATALAVRAGEALVTATVMGQRATARVVVTSATVARIAVEPSDPRVPVAMKTGLQAFAFLSDGTKQEVTSQAAWVSNDPGTAAVETTGLGAGVVTGVRPGMAMISAALLGVTGTTRVTVTSATLMGMEIAPAAPRLPVGASQRFVATALYSDGTTGDVTAQAIWGTDTPAVLMVTAGMPGTALALQAGMALVTARLGMVVAATLVTVSAAPLTALAVMPEQATVPRGATQAFTAVGTYGDGTTADLTRSVVWSADDMVASVSNAPGTQGRASALAPGTTRVIATLGGVSGTAALTVSTATVTALVVAPATAMVVVNATVALTATARLSDGTTRDVTDVVAWSAADPGVVFVSNAIGTSGIARGLGGGMTTVQARLGALSSMASLTVTTVALTALLVEPLMAQVPAGRQQPFKATATYADGSSADVTQQALWSVEDVRVAAISNAAGSRGLVTGTSPGATTVKARLEGKEATARLTVTEEDLTGLRITPVAPNVQVDETVPLVASAIYGNGSTRPLTAGVAWASSDPATATISAAGALRCLVVGKTMITASYQGRTDTVTALCTDPPLMDLQVTPFTSVVLIGGLQPYQAIAVFADFTTRDVTNLAEWSTTDPAIGIVTNTAARGRASGVGAGIAKITATHRGRSAGALLTVSDARLTSVNVSPIVPTTRVGQAVQLQAVGLYSDGIARNLTALATWTSSNAAVADVSNVGARGRATAFVPGTTTVTATFMGLSDGTTLTVATGKATELQVTPVNVSLVVGQRQQLQAVVLYDDGTNQNVTATTTWASSDDTVADVSNGVGRGQAVALKAGATTVTGHFMGLTAQTALVVTDAKLVEIQVTPVNATLPRGVRQQLAAVGVYADGSNRNLTGQASWVSANRAVVAVSTTAGQVTALAPGASRVTAVFGGVTGATTVTVTDAALKEIQVSPAVSSLPRGLDQSFQAVAVYSDGTSRVVTGLVTWNSDDERIAAVSNAAGKGVVTAVAAGSVKISATLEGVSGSGALTVNGAALKQIQVTPGGLSLPKGLAQQLHAVGIYEDGGHRTLTGQVTWNSSDEAIAAVTNVGGRGVLTAVAPGNVKITATFGGVTGEASATVSDARLLELQVTPVRPSLPRGIGQRFTAIGVFSDGSARDLTGVAAWTSSDPAVAAISDAPGWRGRATTLAVGSARMTASYFGVSGATELKVTAATVTQIQVIPARVNAPVGVRVQLAATAVLSDNTTLPVTDSVTWTSSQPAFVVVSNAPDDWGEATALGVGTATISATLLGVSGTAVVAVAGLRVVSLAIRPAEATVARGGRVALTAVATYDDASTYDVTNLATWTTSERELAAVSNVDGARGQATGLAAGAATITATYAAQTASARVTVAP